MFGWSRPTCPIDADAKAWIEQRLAWLANEFGIELFARREMILPLAMYFPDRYDATDRCVRRLLDRVCDYMGVDPHAIDLEFFTDAKDLWLVNERGHYLGRPAGMYDANSEQTTVYLETSQFHDPMLLVGTIAHELAHHRLLGENRIDPESYDHELLTDLTVVFHGLGIFLANLPRAWASDFTTWPGTESPRPEYMTQPMYGYALAHAAWLRNERKPAWARHLRPDARACFKQGVQYLFETGDSTFKPVIDQAPQ